MDDTRMDLSQFEDGTGRSVPTTPLTSAPPIIITEAPPSEAESAPQTQEQQPPEIVISAAPSGDVPDNQQAERLEFYYIEETRSWNVLFFTAEMIDVSFAYRKIIWELNKLILLKVDTYILNHKTRPLYLSAIW